MAYDSPPAHHASCRVAVDATAKLLPAEMLPGIGDRSSPAQNSGQGASSNASDSWANEVIQVFSVTHTFSRTHLEMPTFKAGRGLRMYEVVC